MKTNSHRPVSGIIQESFWREWGQTRKVPVEQTVFRPRFELQIFRRQIRSANHFWTM